MSSLLQDIGIAEAALADLAAFAAGQPISATISGYSATIVHLPNGPTPEFQQISGGFLQILIAVVELGTEFAAGVPISIAAKEGNTWYGITLSKAAPVTASAPAAAV